MARRPAAVLATACGAHFIHDGFADILYVLFPIWSGEFALSLTQVGVLKTAYSGGMAGFQVPAGLLAERWGERRLLAAGTAVTALGFLALGLMGGFVGLLACLLLAGIGSGVQHPLSSSLVSRAYEDGRRVALGTYNFSGDMGKVVVPAAVAFGASWMGWREATRGYAIIGLAAAALVLGVLARLGAGHGVSTRSAGHAESSRAAGWGIRDARGFRALSAIHVIDNGTRTAFLTFLPFLLIAKGSSVQAVGMALMLVFAGGAAGKLACGALADRLGVIRTVVITEALTGAGILLLLAMPLGACLTALPLLGIALNGTSSVLYGTVADLVHADRRARSYAVFYTLGIGASALAPFVYGLLGDLAGVPVTLGVVGVMVFLTIPLTTTLRASVVPIAVARGA